VPPSRPALRLDAILSRFGYCSRRESRFWIRDGRVSVNGSPAKSPSEKADPSSVLIDGEPVDCPDGILAVFHKPPGSICTHDEEEGSTIYEWLPERWQARNPQVTSIGRLDKDASGVLLLTDQPELVHRWTSPKAGVPKVYEVEVSGALRPELVTLFESGTLRLPGEETACRPAKLEILSPHQARLELTEGRFHQVKRMFAAQGFQVTRLHRSQFGPFKLEGLEPGQWRLLPAADGG
jgi:16S rRNA pseudouridine516 synthase